MIIKATSDLVFKYIFGRPSNQDILLSLVNSIMEDAGFPKMASLKVKNPFTEQDYHDIKTAVLDIKAEADNGEIYNIEMQSSSHPGYPNRSLYYWSKLYANQLSSGDKYPLLNPVICINICNFNLLAQKDQYHSCFMITEQKNPDILLSDHLRIHFLELPKVNEYHPDKEIESWLNYLKLENNENKEEDMTILMKNPSIKRAHKEFKKFTADDKAREEYEKREKYQIDMELSRNYAILQAETEKERELNIQHAKKMKEKGYSVNDIAEITGLSEEEIGKL